MRATEFLSEDPIVKNKVIRALGKIPDDDPIFHDVYKRIVSTPLSGRIDAYIKNRKDPDAIKAMKWLISAIPTLGTAPEVKSFLAQFKDPNFDCIDIKKLVPAEGMTGPAPVANIVIDPFAKQLFNKIFQEFSGKGDAGPGEAAFAILSPHITYSTPGDISINGVKVEVKAARSKKGGAGRIWDKPIDQKGMTAILRPMGIEAYTVLNGNAPFTDPKMSKAFIQAACLGWFGERKPKIEKLFGTANFSRAWQAEVFNTYKEEGKWHGMLALGISTYQYIISGEQFAEYMGKSFQGSLYKYGAKQARELAPQVMIK
jgi:hypothetical protein